MRIEPLTIGIGDRFGKEGIAQLKAFVAAEDLGIRAVPVWNKSNREHTIIGSEPADVLAEGAGAVEALGWKNGFHIDADHIGLGNVDRFLAASDFFTIDVADFSGQPAGAAEIEAFVARHDGLAGRELDGIGAVSEADLRSAATKYLLAMQEAGKVYRHILKSKDNMIVEVSVDETDRPQSPVELLLILRMIADEGIPVQTIAPKFTGEFYKGIDYVGDVDRFAAEFEADLIVLKFAIREFGLPETLKLSVHSGSDKFSLYPVINRLIKKHGAGLHLKTAGTTWLEEVIGLAESGGSGLEVAKEIYRLARPRFDELVKPYAPVVAIDLARLPDPAEVERWDAGGYVAALRHDQSDPRYNLNFRQFIHVSFRIAAELGPRYLDALDANREVIARNVCDNLLIRHLVPLFR